MSGMVGATTTDPVQDAIAAILAIVAILGYLAQRESSRTGKKVDKVVDKVSDQGNQLDTTTQKLDEVHALVNDQLSQAVNRRDASEARARVLEDEAKGA
jgi:hypothetical protein